MLKKANEVLKNNGVILLPTETVFGLAVIFDSKVAFSNLMEVKHRPSEKNFPIAVNSIDQICMIADLSEYEKKVVEAILPDSITVIVKVKDEYSFLTNNGAIAVRYSKNSLIYDIIEKVGKPLLLTSANISGEEPVKSVKEAKKVFGDKVGYYIDGRVMYNRASTIIDIRNNQIIEVRKGPISLEKIKSKIENI